MNRIGFLILFMIFCFDMIHGLEHSKLSKDLDHNSQKRRNIVSGSVLSSDIIAKRADSTSLTDAEIILNRIIRSAANGAPSITCNTTADCLHIAVNAVCVPFSALTVGICIPYTPSNAATSMINGMNIVFAFILSTLILSFR